MKRIVLVLKGPIEALPPVMTTVRVLSDIGIEIVVIVDECSETTKKTLCENNSNTVHCLYTSTKNAISENVVSKLWRWRNFHKQAWKTIKDVYQNGDALWIGSADTALALGKKLFSFHYFLHVHELYDTAPFYRNGLGVYARNARRVIVPDLCRAAIMRVWWKLPETPAVVPNKPLDHPRQVRMPIQDLAIQKKITEIGDHPIVLYQGHIAKERNLNTVAKAVSRFSGSLRLVLLGKNHEGLVSELSEICPNLLYLGYMSAPTHLTVTSYAAVGVLQYDYSMLNHIFCAPNKIWEYAGFGIPALAADLPSLRYCYERFGAGTCVDFNSVDAIEQGLNELLENRNSYVRQSHLLFDSCNMFSLYRNIIDE